jgi:hypothetical protein
VWSQPNHLAMINSSLGNELVNFERLKKSVPYISCNGPPKSAVITIDSFPISGNEVMKVLIQLTSTVLLGKLASNHWEERLGFQ